MCIGVVIRTMVKDDEDVVEVLVAMRVVVVIGYVVVVLVGMWVGDVMWLIRKPERKRLRETNGQSSISFFQMPIYRMRKWET